MPIGHAGLTSPLRSRRPAVLAAKGKCKHDSKTTGKTNLVGVALLSPVGIPDEFELVLPADEKRLPCTVVWRSANQIGVAFRPEERT
jgi:hypothetical protein